MPGGLMSLLAVGAQDQYLTVSPEMSFWKQVYKRHTNFSMESISQTFISTPTLSTNRSKFSCRIGRHGDLLNKVYLSIQLPDIYSDGNLRFRWVKNLASTMIYSYSVDVDTQSVDLRWGEFMDIWNELTHTVDKKYAFDRMTGNTEDFIAPRALKPKVIVDNNNLAYSFYPAATPTMPSIKGKRLYIPLDLWFTKDHTASLPLVALQYQNIDVTVELRAITDLYQIYDNRTGEYVSPSTYAGRYPGVDVSISRFTKYGGGGPQIVPLNAYLDCNFIFLDTIERNYVATSNPDYLVERIYRNEIGGVKGQQIVDLTMSNPVKEIFWVLRRRDAFVYNDWGNYSTERPEKSGYPILDSAKVVWNGMDRFELKPAAYFNVLQPYQHHSTSPREGIYCYSFALYPEKTQPSGSFNATMISKIQMLLSMINMEEEYDLFVYAMYYNIFRVISGSGQMVFAA